MYKNVYSIENTTIFSKNFLFLLISNTISSLGDYIYDIGIVIHLYKITGSPTVIGGFFIFQFIPSLVFTPFVGTLIDRLNKKNILIYTSVIRALVVGLLLFQLSTETVYLTAIILGICDEIYRATHDASIPQIINNDQIIHANSIFSVADSITMIIGPVIAGLLIVTSGIYGSIGINAITFAIAAVLLIFINFDLSDIDTSKRNLFNDVKKGLEVIINNKLVKQIIIIRGLLLIGVGATGALIIILISDYMHLPMYSYGWIIAAEGAGIVIGSLIIIKKINNINCGKLIQYGLFSIGSALIVTSLTSNLVVLLIAYFAIGFGAAAAPIGIRTILQTRLPKNILGRVFMSVRFIGTTLRTLSIAIASILANYISLRIIFLIVAIVVVIASFISGNIEND